MNKKHFKLQYSNRINKIKISNNTKITQITKNVFYTKVSKVKLSCNILSKEQAN